MEKKVQKKPVSMDIEKEKVLQVVIIADTFNGNFEPASNCVASLPLVNCTLVEYSLDWFSFAGVNEVIMLCSPNSMAKINAIANEKSRRLAVRTFSTEGCHSFGDVMRALDKYDVIKNTFILLTIDVIGNVKFQNIMEKFKNIEKIDKKCCMMLILKGVGKYRNDMQNKSVIAYNSTGRLIQYNDTTSSKTVNLTMDVLLEQDFVDVRNDIMNFGLAVCSIAVPPLFSDNFDFQTMNDLLKDLLINDELIQSTVYCHVLDVGEYLTQVHNWPMYQIASRDIINRWCFPIVPDSSSSRYTYKRNSVYVKKVTFSNECTLGTDVVIGDKTILRKGVNINRSVIGNSCIIGEGVIIENSFIFDNVKIDAGSHIKYSVISNNCNIKEGCMLNQNCIIGPGVTLPKGTIADNVRLMTNDKNLKLDNFSKNVYHYKSSTIGDDNIEDVESPGLVLETNYNDQFSENEESDYPSESDDSESIGPELDDVATFYNEVFDSLTRGFEDKLNCGNLILEINSSRYAYNITLNEVNYNVVKAILNIEHNNPNPTMVEEKQHLSKKLKYFLKLFQNYIQKNVKAHADCLLALVDVSKTKKNIAKNICYITNFLYDQKILSEDIILEWYNNLPEDDALANGVRPFIEWLQEAEEESSEESS